MSDTTQRTGTSPPQDAGDALAPGTMLGEFEIREVIGAGGFGIVYRAWDTALEREVAIKEFMPVTLAGRGADARVTLRSRASEEDFALGLRSFVNEARLLARFDHPALVKVHRFWEGNGTAYMAMPFYRGKTLRQLRLDMGAKAPDEAWLRTLIDPLLGALEVLHRADVFHRDIAPDNVIWCEDGRAVLLDFGAARQVLADRTQTLTAILKPQFAPIEQYADTQSMRQGPWTDLYGLASTCYYMLTGRAPLPATARVLDDGLTPLAQLAVPGCSARLLEALDWAMAVRPQERPQSAAALRDVLDGRGPLPVRGSAAATQANAAAQPDASAAFEKTVVQTRAATSAERKEADPTPKTGRRWLPGVLVLAVLAGAGAAAAWFVRPQQNVAPAPSPQVSAVAPAVLPSAPVAAASAEASAASSAGVMAAAASSSPQEVAAVPAPAEPAAAASASAARSQPHKSSPSPSPATETAAQAAIRATPTPQPVPAHAAPARDTAGPDEAAAPAASAASAAGHRRSLRDVCTDDGATNVNACIKRLCDNVPRFANYPACVHLREKQGAQASPG